MGDGDETASKVLKCYVSTFNFHGLGFDDALRKFLSAFRLPGEAQRIERIMDAFSAQFFANNPGEILLGTGSTKYHCIALHPAAAAAAIHVHCTTKAVLHSYACLSWESRVGWCRFTK